MTAIIVLFTLILLFSNAYLLNEASRTHNKLTDMEARIIELEKKTKSIIAEE